MKNIVILMGSKSDEKKLVDGFNLLDELKVGYTKKIISAHRDPEGLRSFCREMERKGAKVVIACAGLACALPGFVASYVSLPVIGVPLQGGMLDGLDSLLSIVQAPKGLGVVSSGPGERGFVNAIIFALEIVALGDKKMLTKLTALKNKFKH